MKVGDLVQFRMRPDGVGIILSTHLPFPKVGVWWFDRHLKEYVLRTHIEVINEGR